MNRGFGGGGQRSQSCKFLGHVLAFTFQNCKSEQLQEDLVAVPGFGNKGRIDCLRQGAFGVQCHCHYSGPRSWAQEAAFAVSGVMPAAEKEITSAPAPTPGDAR